MSLAGRILRRLTGRTNAPKTLRAGVIDYDRELPWLQEQVKAYAGMYRVRSTIFQDNFTGETVEMRTAYRHALAEPAVKTALLGKIGSVMALGLQVKPARDYPLDHEIADFVRHGLTKSQGGLPDIIWTILAGGLIDGWSVSEKVWRRERRGHFAGKIALQKLKAKDSRYIQFEIDPFRNVTGVIAMRGNAGEIFPPSDFVLFKYLSLFENPFGMSDLRAAYRAAQMIPKVLLLRMIFLDKYSGPFISAKVGDPALVDAMKQSLAEARAGGFIVMTPQDEIEIKDLAARGTSEFLAAIDDLRKEIAISVSGAFLHMMTGGGQDQRGNSQVQQDTVDLFIWLLKTLVENCINEQLVPDLVQPNYGDAVDFPTVTLEAPNPELIVAELAIDQALDSLDLPLSASELYERTGRRPPKDEADRVRKAPAPGADFFANAQPGQHPPAQLPAQFTEFLAAFAEWQESKHPRADDGKFGSGGGRKSAEYDRKPGKQYDRVPGGEHAPDVKGVQDAIAGEFASDIAANPTLGHKIGLAVAKAYTRLYPIAVKIGMLADRWGPEILDTAEDFEKPYKARVGTTGETVGAATGNDPFGVHLGIPGHVALGVIARVAGIIAGQVAKRRPSTHAEAGIDDAIDAVLELLTAYRELTGREGEPMPSREEVADKLAGRSEK